GRCPSVRAMAAGRFGRRRGPMNDDPNSSGQRASHPPRRPVRLLDLMGLVAGVALALIAPAIMKGIIPAEKHATWDRRQYVAHLASLVLFWWTAILVALALVDARSGLRRSCRGPGHAALFAVAAAFLFLGAQQAVSVLVLGGVVGW